MKTLLFTLFTCFAISAFAQSNKEDVDFIQAIYGKEKKIIMADFIKIDGAAKDAFWKLYDEYEDKRKALGKKRIALLERYVTNYATLDDATTSELVKETIALTEQTDKLVATYYKKIEKACGAKPAAQFYELEAYLLSAVRANILQNIPFIGELD